MHVSRSVPAVLAAALVAALAVPAGAGHGADPPGGPYDGFATGSVLHVDAVTPSSARAIDVEVGLGAAAVHSEGLERIRTQHQRTIVPEGIGGKHARGYASVWEVGALLRPPFEQNQTRPWVATSDAPGGERADDTLLEQAFAPALYTDLARRTANARWNNGTCVIGEPVSLAETHLARTQLISFGDDPETDELDNPILALDADADGPARATSHVVAREQLFAAENGRFGLQSVVATTLAPVTFFDGSPQEFTVEADGSAVLSAAADGTRDGADVSYRAPLVSVIQNEEATQVVPGEPFEVAIPNSDDVIARVRVGTMSALPAPIGLGDRTARADGTHASAQAHVVEIELLDLPSQEVRGATVALGHMEAVATVPDGGIECPIPVTKRAEPEEVAVGDIFTTTITVTNPFECDLVGVSLRDVIRTEDAARFTVAGAEPGATRITGGEDLREGSVRWSSLGTIAAGESKKVRVTLEAQGGAGVIADTATAKGTLENCPAGLGSGDADVTALAEVDVEAAGKGTLEVPEAKVLGAEFGRDLPRTGIGAGAGMLILSAAGAAAVLLRRRKV